MRSGSKKPWWWRDLQVTVAAPVLVWICMGILIIEAVVVSILFH